MSTARIRILRNPATLFGFTAVTVAAVCVAITRSRLFPSNPDLAALGPDDESALSGLRCACAPAAPGA